MMQPPPPPPPPPQVEVMALTAASAAAQQQHQHMLLDLQAQRLASSMDVPTLPDQVRTALRNLNCPVRLFGENLANVRDRLRLELAKRKVYEEHYGSGTTSADIPSSTPSSTAAQLKQEETKYSRALPELVKAREKITAYSLQRAKERLIRERALRASYKNLQSYRKRRPEDSNSTNTDPVSEDFQQAEKLDQNCCQFYQSLQQTSLAGSQYGDVRALSSLTTLGDRVLTAGWSATLQWWDGSTPALDLLGRKRQAHEDRIMGVAVQKSGKGILAGTASIDLTAKLWTVKEADTEMKNVTDDEEEADEAPLAYEFEQVAHITGHAARLCKIAFHPMGDLVATTSHDHTWRLWDIETANENCEELLLQDGHADKVFGIDFHPDGSLCAVSDYSGMIHLWDLRTGKSALHYFGHAGRVLCAKFAPTNGFQLTTAGDDGSMKVWDLRHRRKAKGNIPEPRRTIPAHSKLIPQLEYTADDEVLVSCSFDGTAKLWSTRGDWKLLQTLAGHEGKVMGVGIVADYEDKKAEASAVPKDWGVVTCGYDKTLKLWR